MVEGFSDNNTQQKMALACGPDKTVASVPGKGPFFCPIFFDIHLMTRSTEFPKRVE